MKLTCSGSFLFLLAAAFILVPIPWLAAWICTLIIHECFHYIALRLCGGNVQSIQVGHNGIIMETRSLSFLKEAICAYAGPIGGLLVLLLAKHIPRVAICTLFLSAYNMLPIFPLDGGRGLGCLLRKYLSKSKAERVQRCIENGTLLIIILFSIYAVMRLGLGLLPAGIATILLVRSKGIKFPCKKLRIGLQ